MDPKPERGRQMADANAPKPGPVAGHGAAAGALDTGSFRSSNRDTR